MITLQTMLHFVGEDLLETLACQYQLDRSHSVRLSGPILFLCLLNAQLNHPELTQRLLEETFHQHTGRTADHSSFGKYLGRVNPSYFEAIFRALYRKLSPEMTPGDQASLRLRLVDATTVTLSAKLLHFGILNGTRRKKGERRHVKSVFELSEGGLPNLLCVCKEQSQAADDVALGDTMVEHAQPNDLFVFDKGCHCRTRMLRLHQQGAFFLTPLSTQQVQVQRLLWQAPEQDCPTQEPTAGQPSLVLRRVEVGTFANSQPSRNKDLLSLPLVLLRTWRYDRRKRTWVDWTLVTNLPVREEPPPLTEGTPTTENTPLKEGTRIGPFRYEELLEVYRMRWNIETFFKFLKQHLSYRHLTSRSENGIRVMIYMGLIASLLLIWYRKLTGIDRGWKSVKFWLAENARLWAEQILGQAPVPDG